MRTKFSLGVEMPDSNEIAASRTSVASTTGNQRRVAKFSDRIYTALNRRTAAYAAWQRTEGGKAETDALDAADEGVREVMQVCDELLEACKSAYKALNAIGLHAGYQHVEHATFMALDRAITKAEGR